jgi:hypothetical protein
MICSNALYLIAGLIKYFILLNKSKQIKLISFIGLAYFRKHILQATLRDAPVCDPQSLPASFHSLVELFGLEAFKWYLN